jgi:hypothetical protein
MSARSRSAGVAANARTHYRPGAARVAYHAVSQHEPRPAVAPASGGAFLAAHRADFPITFHDSERNVRYIMRAGRNGPASCFFLLRELARRVVPGNSLRRAFSGPRTGPPGA